MNNKNPYAIPYTGGRDTEPKWVELRKEIRLKIDAILSVTDDLGIKNDQGSPKWTRPMHQILEIIHELDTDED